MKGKTTERVDSSQREFTDSGLTARKPNQDQIRVSKGPMLNEEKDLLRN